VFLNAAGFVWWAFAMFSRLIDDRSRQQFRRLEFADREALKPGLLAARETLKLRTPDIPQFDVDAIRTALAEEEDSHWLPVYDWSEQKAKQCARSPFFEPGREEPT
jgi:hypothetical protein